MSEYSYPISSETAIVDVNTTHGDIEIRAALGDEPGYVESEAPLSVESQEGVLLFRDDQGRATDLVIVIPTTVRELRASTGNGDVEIGNGIVVDLQVQTGRGDIEAGSGRSGRISTGNGDVQLGSWSGSLRVDTGKGSVEIDAAGGDLKATTGKGDIRVGQASGQIDVNTGKGNLVVGRVSGDARLHTGHGDVVVTDAADARLDVETGRGNIVLDGRLARLHAHTGHGDASCRCSFVGETFEVVTDRGNIRAELTAEPQLRIEAITQHGRVESTLPLVRVGRPGPAGAHSQRFVASLGGTNATASLRLFSAHGDIWLGRSGESGAWGQVDEPAENYSFEESATARAWAETIRAFGAKDIATKMASLGERLGKQVEARVEEAMGRVEREMEHLEHELERAEERAEEEAEREEEEEEREETEREEQEEEHEEAEREEEAERSEYLEVERANKADSTASTPGSAPTPRTPPAPVAVAPATRSLDSEMAILEAISRNEISVDEAMVLLARLEAEPKQR